jgi:hypothetical protein
LTGAVSNQHAQEQAQRNIFEAAVLEDFRDAASAAPGNE